MVYFNLTCFISTGAFFAASNMHNPFPAFAVAFGIWVPFLWGVSRRQRKIAERKSQERMFTNYMRSKFRNR
ncbi:MAG: hypothetical protein JSU01_20830 [Bacteroidetes bacterium]|nr:hypothetical protein [Bacteroidota bacterium]